MSAGRFAGRSPVASFAISVRPRELDWPPPVRLPFPVDEVSALVLFSVALAVGVGRSCAARLGSIRSPLLPRWFGPPFVPSVARGVGISFIGADGAVVVVADRPPEFGVGA